MPTIAPQRKKKLTLFTLILLLVIIALAGIGIFSALRAAQAKANEASCCSRLQSIVIAMEMYRADNGGAFPALDAWCDAVTNYPMAKVWCFRCPSAPQTQVCGYAINLNLNGVKGISQVPGDTVVLFESDAGWNGIGGLTNASARHYGPRLWVGFADGSVKDVWLKDLASLRWIPATNAAPAEAK